MRSPTIGSATSTTTTRPPEVFRTPPRRRAPGLVRAYAGAPRAAAALARRRALPRRALGNLVEMDFLDTRQFRTNQPCDDGFKPACPGVDDPRCGGARRRAGGLARPQPRPARRALELPRPAGHDDVARPAHSRRAGARSSTSTAGPPMRCRAGGCWRGCAGLDNVVVLTGDEHQNFAGLLHDRDTPVAVEFVATSISSDGDGADLPRRQRPHPRRESAAEVHQLPARLSDLRRHPRRMAHQLHGPRPRLDARAAA